MLIGFVVPSFTDKFGPTESIHLKITDMCRQVLVIVTVCMWLPLAAGYSSGAPDKACPGIAPIHVDRQTREPLNARTTTPPYRVDVSAFKYAPNQEITIRITGTNGYKVCGFLLQVRRADWRLNTAELIGNFSVTDGTKSTCSRHQYRGLTHSSGYTQKGQVVTVWTAPPVATGHLKLYATFAINHTLFWGKNDYAFIEDPTAEPLPTGGPPRAGSASQPIDTSSCGRTKGCYRKPPGCSQSQCDYLVTWKRDGNYVNFEMESKTDGWVAVGVSDTTSMHNTSVTDCVYNDQTSEVMVQMSYNLLHSDNNEVNDDRSAGLDTFSSRASYIDGRIRCRFRRVRMLSGVVSEQTKTRVFNLNKPYYLMIGRGPSQNGNKREHREIPPVSKDKVDLDQMIDVTGTQGSPPLVKLHAILMSISWVLLASAGIMMAHAYKDVWSNVNPFGLQLWFVVHRSVMVLATFLTVIGMVIIFVHVRGYSQMSEYPSKAHPPLGICVTILVIVNPVMAIFRPEKDSPNRPLFNWVHWGVGLSAYTLAMVAILIGLGMQSASVPSWAFWVTVATIIFDSIFYVGFDVYKYIKKMRDKGTDELTMVDSADGREGQPQSVMSFTDSPDDNIREERIKQILFWIYLPVMVTSTVIIVIAIATN